MSIFKCKMCGGTLEIQNGSTVAECEYCGAKQTLPRLDDERRVNLYDRANHFRRNNEFDKASAIYEQILAEDNTDAEAYWSLVLCRYGIEYVEDPTSHRRVPTVNRAQFTSIFDDANYKSALKYADTYQKIIYEEESKAINEIQKGILAISQKEEPFDVFICYKETDASGRRTHDSVLAQELYYQLKQEGFKVFFARITLEDKLGTAYEPYIFAALNSAKVMVVLGTKPEFFNAVWVKNEWSRYLSLIKQGEKKILIPAYKDMDPYDLPTEFSHLQAQDMSKLGFMQDLIRGIKKILGKDKKSAESVGERVVANTEGQNTAPLLRRAFLFLEDGEFDNANEYAEKVLDINPECAEAYVVKLLIEHKLIKPSDLATCSSPISNSPNYQKAIRFASPEYRETIEGYNNTIIKRIDTARKDEIYSRGVELMLDHRFDEAVQCFEKITSHKDSAKKIDDCKQLKETERRDCIYQRATQLLNAGQFDEAARLFKSIEDHKDSKEKIKLCAERKENARKDAIYSRAIERVLSKTASDADIKKSIEELHTISGYRDVDDQIRALNARLEKWYEDKKKAEEAARIKAEEDRRTREREAELRRIKAEKTKKTVKKVAKIGIPSVIALVTFLILLFTLVIPLIRYNTADKLFNEGKYEEAMAIYKDIGGFSDSEQRITVLNGIKEIDEASFEEGIKTILSAGVPVKITYGMGGGDFSGTTHLSAPDENNESGIMLLSASTSNVTPFASETTMPEIVEVTLSSSDDFVGLGTPGRNGYRFVKWEFEAYAYQVNGTFEIKFNAIWSTKDYIVKYDLDGGKVFGENVDEYDPEDDAFSLINPTRTGYTFAGWIGTDLSEPTINVTVPTGSYGDRTYTATWTANEYTVTYDAAGGTVSSETQKVYYDSDVEYFIPERAGYKFLGWYENATKHENEKWTRTYDLTLVAKWEIVNYKINYELGGGINNAGNPATYTVNDETIILKDPSRIGYTFVGWTYEGQSTPIIGAIISKGSTGNKSYTANWNAISSTVTFDPNGGFCDTTTLGVTYDVNVTLPTPEWEGHAFSGWYNGNSKITSGKCKLTENTTLIARWDTIEYDISYTLNGGTNPKANPDSYNYHDEIILAEPSRTGYDFVGWTWASQSLPTKNVTISTGTTGDKSYTANWKAQTYIITFVPDGSSIDHTSMKVEYDADYTLPTPVKSGYSFDGWYDSSDTKVTSGTWQKTQSITLTAKWTIRTDILYTVNHYQQNANNDGYTKVKTEELRGTAFSYVTPDVNSYSYFVSPSAKRVQIEPEGTLVVEYYYNRVTYDLTYVTNGGNALGTKTYKHGQTLSLSTPIRDGFTFGGWFTTATLETAYTPSATLDKDTVIYAYWAEENKPTDFTYSGTSEITIDSYVGSSDTMWIPAYINDVPIANIGAFAFQSCNRLVNVTIPTSVTNIGVSAFSGCSRLTNITIPDSVVSIQGYAFSGCTSLKSITIPDSVTSMGGYMFVNCYIEDASIPAIACGLVKNNQLRTVTITSGESIPAEAFYNCYRLESVSIHNGLLNIGNSAFEGCTNLANITLPDRLTTIGMEAFYNCDCIASITIPNGVTSIGSSAFYHCDNLTSIVVSPDATGISGSAFDYSPIESATIPTSACLVVASEHLKTVVITSGESIPTAAFYDCKNLISITIPDSVTAIGSSAFNGCTSLTNITLPDGLTSIEESAFYNCYKLTDITIPSGVTSINNDVFYGCSSLTSIRIPNGVTSIGVRAFQNCTSLENVTIPDSVTTIGSSSFYKCYKLDNVVIPGGVVSINASTFGSCTSLTGITIPDSVTSICYGAFSYCTSLADVEIGNGVTSIDDCAFQNCTSLTSITIPNGVTSIGSSAFTDCTNLVSVTIGNGVISIGYRAFYYCTSLTSVTIGNSVTSIGESAFYNCYKLTSITIPDSVTSIGSSAFYNCHIEAATIPAVACNYIKSEWLKTVVVTSGESIPDSAFFECSNLLSVELPNSITSIGDSAFYKCAELTSIRIPDSVTMIGDDAFRSCKKLTIINIPDNVTVIGSRAFYYCTGLTSINIPVSVTTIGSLAFYSCTSITIYCEAESIPSGWSSDWNEYRCPVVWGCNE